MAENTQLIKLIETEFKLINEGLEQQGKQTYRTAASQAQLLQVTPSALSHYKNSVRFMSRELAVQFAQKLRETLGTRNSPEEIEVLAAALFAARPVGSAAQAKAGDWLRGIGQPDHLLIGEFRDLPIIRPGLKLSDMSICLTEEISESIAKGLSYAMLFPYTKGLLMNDHLPRPFRELLARLYESLVATYLHILKGAIACSHGTSSLGHNQSGNVDTAVEIRNRFRIYSWRDNSDDQQDTKSKVLAGCPSTDNKTFYYVDPDKQIQTWQWISTPEGEQLIQKGYGLSVTAASEYYSEWKFYPLINYHNEYKTLPSNEQMQKFVDASIIKQPRLWEEIDLNVEEKYNGWFERLLNDVQSHKNEE